MCSARVRGCCIATDGALTHSLPALRRQVGMALNIRRIWIVPVVLIGVGLLSGAGLGGWIGREAVLEEERARMTDYVAAVTTRTAAIFEESGAILRRFNESALAHCSAEQLREMRAAVFQARFVRDIGGFEGSNLVCTTGLGVLSTPIGAAAPDWIMGNGLQLLIDAPVFLARGQRALIVEAGRHNVVIDPDAFQGVLGTQYGAAVFAVDRQQRRFIRLVGPPQSVDYADLVRPGSRVENGTERLSTCRYDLQFCVTATFERSAALADGRGVVLLLLAFGAAVGGLVATLAVAWLNLELSLTTRLRRALEADDLFVRYQPQVTLPDGRILGAEALVRWTLPDTGPVRPDVFIELAERRGLIGRITETVIRHCERDLGDVLRQSPAFRISINVAPADLKGPALEAHLQKYILGRGILPSQITLEVTERGTAENRQVVEALNRLRAHGFRIAIDDFGTGYSSLSYLQTLPFDELKIDKSFTDTVGTRSVREGLVPNILDIAAKLGLEVVAEGLETHEQVAYFADVPRVIGQGWLFGKPMSADALANRLLEERQLAQARGRLMA